jgi:hypothetical protein
MEKYWYWAILKLKGYPQFHNPSDHSNNTYSSINTYLENCTSTSTSTTSSLIINPTSRLFQKPNNPLLNSFQLIPQRTPP